MDILDASGLLALVKKEKGSEVIRKLFNKAENEKRTIFMHQINYVEFLYRCRKMYSAQELQNIIADLQSPFFGIANYMDLDLGFYSSELKSDYHLSLGDSIGLAYAKIMNGTFWTADSALKPVAEKEKIGLMLIR